MSNGSDWSDGYIAVDWGTTNRRAYRISANGEVTAAFEDARGVLSIDPGQFPQEIVSLRQRLGDLPALLAGMVGSRRGWREAPYVGCPARIDDLLSALLWVDDRTAIVPGLSFDTKERSDVMRGEEVQLFGAMSVFQLPRQCTICQPGTHNKWAQILDGAVLSFRTALTGDLFAALKARSALTDLMCTPVEIGEPFFRGVRHSMEKDDLLGELFAVRARVMLGHERSDDVASYVSGLLIGSDVKLGTPMNDSGEVHVVGSSTLTSLYSAALKCTGRPVLELDGQRAFIGGISGLVRKMARR